MPHPDLPILLSRLAKDLYDRPKVVDFHFFNWNLFQLILVRAINDCHIFYIDCDILRFSGPQFAITSIIK